MPLRYALIPLLALFLSAPTLAQADITDPELLSVEMDRYRQGTGGCLRVDLGVRETGSGLRRVLVSVLGPSGVRRAEDSFYLFNESEAIKGDSVLVEMCAEFPEAAEEGVWQLDQVLLSDFDGNWVHFTNSYWLAQAGFSASTLVQADNEAPVLSGFAITPSSVLHPQGNEANPEAGRFAATVHLADTLSGVARVSVEVVPERGYPFRSAEATAPTEGDEVGGVWRVPLTLQPTDPTGTWYVHRVQAWDAAGNSVARTRAQLEAEGVDVTFEVTSTPTAGETAADSPLPPGAHVYPNPVADVATAEVISWAGGTLRASVYDALGREVAGPFDVEARPMTPTTFPLPRLVPGLYVLRVLGPDGPLARPFTVAR